MARHERFQELCAAAGIGEASGEELLELERHAAVCDACRQAYLDFLNVASQQFVAAKQDPTLSPQDVQECLDSELLIRRFFDRAEREGIVFSEDVDEQVNVAAPIPFRFSPHPFWNPSSSLMAIAATLTFFLATSIGYLEWRRSFSPNHTQAMQAPQRDNLSHTQASDADLHLAELSNANLELRSQVERLTDELHKADNPLAISQSGLMLSSQELHKLAGARDALENQLVQVRRELSDSETTAVSAEKEAAGQRRRANDMEATLVADQVKMRELEEGLKDKSAELDQAHQLLSLGHDITNLMAARNLHIVDVADTDTRGETRRAFGRIFFTEGKSLIFYAYDLNEEKMQKANYQYQVWAKKEGQNQRAQRLGIFYSDDKAQHRWVFKCDDPAILGEIDSVFVTLGRPNGAPSHPEGSSLMYAYLRGHPNHP